MKIKIPQMPEPHMILSGYSKGTDGDWYRQEQILARDQQWLDLVGPVVEALGMFTDFPDDMFESNEDGPFTMTVRLAVMRGARAALRAITEEQQ